MTWCLPVITWVNNVIWCKSVSSLQWRHNGYHGVSNHQPCHCLLNSLFGRRSKKTSKLASLAFVWRIYRWPVNFEFPAQIGWPVMRKMFPFDDSSCWATISYINFIYHWLKYRRLFRFKMPIYKKINLTVEKTHFQWPMISPHRKSVSMP